MNKRVKGKRQRGFTLIEVLMFLAISGALLGLMIFAVYRMIAGARFSDTITSAASFVQLQYEEARSGVRPEGESLCGDDLQPGRSDCLLLGKAIVFRQINPRGATSGFISDNIESYFVISDPYNLDISKANLGGLDPDGLYGSGLQASNPQLVVAGHRWYPLLYQAHYASTEDNDNSFTAPGMFYRNDGVQQGGYDDIWSSCPAHVHGLRAGCMANVIFILREPKSSMLNTYTLFIDLPEGISSAEEIVDTINDKVSEDSFFSMDGAPGMFIRNMSVAIPIVNGDSNSRSLGAICIEQGVSSASIYGARDLSYYANMNRGLGWNRVVALLRDRCENM
ncbi:type II secretion system GspH family protein [Candidatus Saccharibacteria bacterium]|nr:type II secretion system GspH family protein [Candidatus Saccharibacteria bacterium]